MKKMLILTSALCGLGFAAQAQNKEVNVVSWGGAYEKSQVEAYNIPFERDRDQRSTCWPPTARQRR